MNLGTKKVVETSTVFTDEMLAQAHADYCDAKEIIAQAGVESLELTQVLNNIDFVASKLRDSKEPEKMMDALDVVASCEGLIEMVNGKLPVDKAVEGLGDLMKSAWEKIVKFFGMLADACKKVANAITSGAKAKEIEEESSILEEVPDGAAKEKQSAPVKVVTPEQFDAHEKAFSKYAEGAKADTKAIHDLLSKIANDPKNAGSLVSKLEETLSKADSANAQFAELSKKIDQVAENTKAYSLEEAGWKDLKIRDIGKKIKYLWNKGPAATEIKELEKMIKAEQAMINKMKDITFTDEKARNAVIKASNKAIHCYQAQLNNYIKHNHWYWKTWWVIKGCVKGALKGSWKLIKNGSRWTWENIKEGAKKIQNAGGGKPAGI